MYFSCETTSQTKQLLTRKEQRAAGLDTIEYYPQKELCRETSI